MSAKPTSSGDANAVTPAPKNGRDPRAATGNGRHDADAAQHGSLLVFSDDWGRHPSSCQHLVRQLLDRWHVAWVNTIGMRTPRLNLATARRGLEKLRDWCGAGRRSASANGSAPAVLKPVMWPWFTRPWDRRLNRALLARGLKRWLATCPRPVTAVATIPLAADLIGRIPVDHWVYYCVDDFSHWPGLDHRPIAAMEGRLIERADVLIAASATLHARLSAIRQTVHLLTHGVDLDHWRRNGHANAGAPCGSLPRPLAAFWGLVDRRLDVRFMEAVSGVLNGGALALVGPEADPDPAIARMAHVRRIPAVAYEHLPMVARAADVLVMPYADLPVTRAMQPLKLLEYLATGKPVVVRDLPATRPWSDCLDIAESPQHFAELVAQRVAAGLPEAQRQARARLHEESWTAKAQQFEGIVLHGQPAGPAARRDSATD